ncbi:MAG: hypothetical protein A2X04_00925 [Bacteroidetes bacterium GWF2_41_9]|nr:MAG: hypothetical protein A2X04_00925 [Bacteroidetes bacterium GWF2_41_9]
MSQINENLIRSVFDEMLKCKATLAKMVLDEEEDDEIVDYRVLADLVIKNFPWPIGVELRRLFSGSMRQLDRMRLDQIFKTIERTMQFLSFVMLSQMVKEKSSEKLVIPENFRKEFENRFLILSMGNFSWMIRNIGNIFADQKIEWFMPEMAENFNKHCFNALDFWIPERNEIGHYQINLNQEEIEKRCVEYEEKLTFILQKIAFLAKYKLVSVKEIKVLKSKVKDADFHHVIDLLNSSDSDFKAREFHEPSFTESQSVLLMKTMKSLNEYLNLSPLIIDTSTEVLDTKEKFNIKKDIFLYSKFRNDQLMYLGTEVTEKCDLRTLKNYDVLMLEFKFLLSVISGSKMDGE